MTARYTNCDVCNDVVRFDDTSYNDFYGDICSLCYEEKVENATVNPWSGRPK